MLLLHLLPSSASASLSPVGVMAVWGMGYGPVSKQWLVDAGLWPGPASKQQPQQLWPQTSNPVRDKEHPAETAAMGLRSTAAALATAAAAVEVVVKVVREA